MDINLYKGESLQTADFIPLVQMAACDGQCCGAKRPRCGAERPPFSLI